MRILVASSPGEHRIALLHNDILTGYSIWRPATPDGLGNIYLGRIIARVPAMAGAFVALPDCEGFLPDSQGAADHTEGDYLTVHITRPAQSNKGPRLAARRVGCLHPTPPTPQKPTLLHPGPTPLDRLATQHPTAPITLDDPTLYATLRPTYPTRLTLTQSSFPDALEAELEALGSPEISLPGGLRATITPTPALVAIDIDGAASTAARGAKNPTQLAANRAAIPELARQIRLRNLAGAILIDFAGLPIKRRATLAPDLTAALAPDPASPRLLGFSHLGLAEILRPRTTAPLHELLSTPHAHALAALRQAAKHPTQRLALIAAPALIDALQNDPAALQNLAHRTTYPLALQRDPARALAHWTLEPQT